MNYHISVSTIGTVTISPEVQVLMRCVDELREAVNLPLATHRISNPASIYEVWDNTLLVVRNLA